MPLDPAANLRDDDDDMVAASAALSRRVLLVVLLVLEVPEDGDGRGGPHMLPLSDDRPRSVRPDVLRRRLRAESVRCMLRDEADRRMAAATGPSPTELAVEPERSQPSLNTRARFCSSLSSCC